MMLMEWIVEFERLNVFLYIMCHHRFLSLSCYTPICFRKSNIFNIYLSSFFCYLPAICKLFRLTYFIQCTRRIPNKHFFFFFFWISKQLWHYLWKRSRIFWIDLCEFLQFVINFFYYLWEEKQRRYRGRSF